MTSTTRRRALIALATMTAATLATTGLTSVPAQAATTEHISNGTFTSTTDPWWGTSNLTLAVSKGQLCTQVPTGTENLWDASVGYNGIPLVNGDKYTVKFSASASVAATIKANVQLSEDPYTATMSRDTALTATMKTFTYTFTSSLDADAGTFTFQLGGKAKAFKFCLDNVSVTSEAGTTTPSGPEQVRNGTFEDADNGWFSYGTSSASVTSGRLCAEVPGGLENLWDAGVGQNDISVVEGATYTLAFEASAKPASKIRAAVQLSEDPYTAFTAQDINLTTSAKKYSYTFTADASTSAAQVTFQVGGASSDFTFCVDNVSLRGGE